MRVTGLPQLEVPLIPDYQFDWFAQDMKPAYRLAVKQIRVAREAEKVGVPAPPLKIEAAVRVSAAKVVANAGREQMIAAVEADAVNVKNLRESQKEAAKAVKRMRKTWGGQLVEDTTPVKDLDVDAPDVVGWARVATGDETCGWCMMLVSRGPVYMDADTAGAKYTSTETLNALDAGVVVPMDEWHTGCDCTVMPVWDKDDWPGKQQADDALERWNEAAADFVFDPDKKYRVQVKGENGKYTFRQAKLNEGEARYRETLNNLRFMLEGRDPSERTRVSKDQLDDILKSVPGAAKLFAKELARR